MKDAARAMASRWEDGLPGEARVELRGIADELDRVIEKAGTEREGGKRSGSVSLCNSFRLRLMRLADPAAQPGSKV